MIQRAPSYITSDGRSFAELKDAQEHELHLLLCNESEPTETDRSIVGALIEKSNQVVDILTTKPNSRVKARAVHGGTKKRKSAADKILEKVTA